MNSPQNDMERRARERSTEKEGPEGGDMGQKERKMSSRRQKKGENAIMSTVGLLYSSTWEIKDAYKAGER